MASQAVGVGVREGMVESLKELLLEAFGTDMKLHLYQSSFTPSPDSVEADFESAEADFNTYAAQAVTFGAVGLDATGQAITFSDQVTFQNVSGANPNTIGGAWLHIDAVGPPAVDKAVVYFPFAQPVLMTTALATMGISIAVTLPTLTGYATVET